MTHTTDAACDARAYHALHCLCCALLFAFAWCRFRGALAGRWRQKRRAEAQWVRRTLLSKVVARVSVDRLVEATCAVADMVREDERRVQHRGSERKSHPAAGPDKPQKKKKRARENTKDDARVSDTNKRGMRDQRQEKGFICLECTIFAVVGGPCFATARRFFVSFLCVSVCGNVLRMLWEASTRSFAYCMQISVVGSGRSRA
jgi:hypothetical protein